jgi:hypothetical protein
MAQTGWWRQSGDFQRTWCAGDGVSAIEASHQAGLSQAVRGADRRCRETLEEAIVNLRGDRRKEGA